MPENVKDEVRKFADYVLILPQYQSCVEKYKLAVESNIRLYTSENDKIKQSVDNAMADLRDRVCQVILKAAVECNSSEKFKVNLGCADESREILKTIKNELDLFPERKEVLSNIAKTLITTGHDDSYIHDTLFQFW
jgi:hypothetical protein